jgi:TPR repeat protein
MIRWILIAWFVTAASLGSCEDAKDTVILASVNYCLTKGEVARYSEEAMAGSAEAATKLANSHWMCGAPDHKQTKYWALIGAENGSAEAQFRVYQTLSVSTNRLEQERALFWLKKAAAQDYLGSRATLERCPSISQPQPARGAPCFGPGSDH